MLSWEIKFEFQIVCLPTAVFALCFGRLRFALASEQTLDGCGAQSNERHVCKCQREQCRFCFLESFIPYLADACLLHSPLHLLQIHQFEVLLFSILTEVGSGEMDSSTRGKTSLFSFRPCHVTVE